VVQEVITAMFGGFQALVLESLDEHQKSNWIKREIQALIEVEPKGSKHR
jgi:hypothetical protein